MKKITFITFSLIGVIFGLVFTSTKINAQSTVNVYLTTIFDGEVVSNSQRTVNQGSTLIYEIEDFPNATFMYWVINGVFRNDLQQDITITVFEDTALVVFFGSELYYNAWYDGHDIGLDIGSNIGYDNGYDEGVSTVYYDGFGGIINPDTNKPYDETYSYPYGKGYNDGLEATNDYSLTGILFQVFGGLGALLTIELLPNLTIGAIVAVPLVFGIIYFILGKRSGD